MPPKTSWIAALVACVGLCAAAPAWACSAFLLERSDEKVFAKGYDWHQSRGHLVVNKKGVQKRALVDPRDGEGAAWTSKHMSVTLNQYGREFPNGGMNDAGLMVEILWLDETGYPKADERPAINALQWVQHQLDRFETTAQVVEHAPKLRVTPMGGAKTHYMVCDASGDCAVFEYLDGALVVSRGDQLGPKAITNDTCASSQNALRESEARKGAAPKGHGSLARYIRAAQATRAPGEGPLAERAKAMLEDVRIEGRTQWQVLYDPKQGTIHWRTAGDEGWKLVRFESLSPYCKDPALAIDLETRAEGDLTRKLAPWDQDANRELVSHGLRLMKQEVLTDFLAALPGQTRCVGE